MPAVVMTSSAKMPSSCWGRYRNVRVVEINHYDLNVRGWDWRPASVQAKEVVRVYRSYGPQSEGKTDRCAYRRALVEAQTLADSINSAGDLATIEQIIGAGGSA